MQSGTEPQPKLDDACCGRSFWSISALQSVERPGHIHRLVFTGAPHAATQEPVRPRITCAWDPQRGLPDSFGHLHRNRSGAGGRHGKSAGWRGTRDLGRGNHGVPSREWPSGPALPRSDEGNDHRQHHLPRRLAHENYGETGMAHLLEHLVFKGTPRHPNIAQEFTDHGSRPNGTTWTDRTNYFETFAATDANLNGRSISKRTGWSTRSLQRKTSTAK